MHLKTLAMVLAGACLVPLPASAEGAAFLQLTNVDEVEALEALSRLAQFQQSVREGRAAAADILAGGAASGPGAQRTASEVLKELPLEHALFAEKVETGSEMRQHFRFRVLSEGLGEPYWTVDMLMLGMRIVRIEMVHTIPPPL